MKQNFRAEYMDFLNVEDSRRLNCVYLCFNIFFKYLDLLNYLNFVTFLTKQTCTILRISQTLER